MVEIHSGDHGFYIKFYLKNVDLTGYDIVLDVWNENGFLVQGSICIVERDGNHTVASYLVPEDVFITKGDYKAQLRIIGMDYEESTDVFDWKVID